MGAMGAGAGFLIDAMIGTRVTVFSAGSTGSRARVEISPIVRKDRQGVAMAFRF